METPPVGTGPVVTTQEPTSRGFSDLASEDFLALLIAELQSQDPMNPTDNKEIVAQMASMRQMEQSALLNETLETLASEQRFAATAGLIGHYVSGTVTNDAGASYEIQGVVIGIRYQHDGKAILELHNGQSLPVDKVEQVTLVENLPQEVLDQLPGAPGAPEDDGGAAAKDGSPAARRATEDPGSGQVRAGNGVRQFGRRADTVASLLDAVFAPGVSIGI